MDFIEDSSHEHPLILLEEGEDTGGDGLLCSGCSKSVVSKTPTYSCTQCKFFLHKSCTELPKKILITLHPRHPLTFSIGKGSILPYWCDHCDLPIHGFIYHCSLCHIGFHITCASKHIFDPQGHDNHSFMILRSTNFICDACGKASDGVSLLCTICQVQVHKKCSSFPLTVKQIGHPHQLSLTYSYQIDALILPLCKICYCTIETVLCFYSCASCTYVTHVYCATAKGLIDETQEQNPISTPDPNGTNDDLIIKDVNKIGLDEENQIVTKIKHNSHLHELTLNNDDERKSDEICDGCINPITIPFYSCAQCNIFLHKTCAELCKKILHPLHPHLLTFKSKDAREAFMFICDGCERVSNGFTYVCVKCDFNLDIKCSSFSDTLEHKGHQHTLSLIPHSSGTECNTCGSTRCAIFRCNTCDFDLDLECASLPYTGKHECHKRNWNIYPLQLIFDSKQDPDQAYCDMCEEQRNPNHWFYYCEDCDYATHPHCLLGKYSIKFGLMYELDCHIHSLTLIEKNRQHPPCAFCNEPCEELIFVCVECNFNVHPHCRNARIPAST